MERCNIDRSSSSYYAQDAVDSDLASEPSKFLYCSQQAETDNECYQLTREVNDVLSQIYKEFYSDFNKRVEKRMKEDPMGEVQQYNMLVQKVYQQDYQSKVEQIVKWKLFNIMHSNLQNNAKNFVTLLKDAISKVSDPEMRLVLLNDAYHVTLNAAEEVGKITSSLFKREKKACKKLNLRYFYEIVCESLKPTAASIHDKEDVPEQIVKAVNLVRDLGFCKLEQDFRTASGDYSPLDLLDMETQSYSTDADTVDDNPTSYLTIDELVNYIDPPKNKRKRRKRKPKSQARTASNSNSPARSFDEDFEVECLKVKLAERKPAEHRLKPNLRADWLQSLRSKLN
mmetsp:Transcript_23568/g.41775  ORF Transcript_23568/g.41775 Transcript_23568/m.41775 type:complete len:341 (+) Transcript_23568:180-1202(+)